MSNQLELGATYICTHSRKGKFHMKIESESDEWVTGEIVQGMAKAMCAHNEAYEGDEITVRKSQCGFKKVR